MQRIKVFFREFWPTFLLGLFSITVFLLNYRSGTWLLGWDNLVPEFNFGLNVQRSFFAAWQEYQGLGLAGGMAHGASLSRELILWPLSLIMPMQLMRYFWTMSMLVIGPIGVWFLTRFLLKQKQADSNYSVAALVAGFFYFFNLATLQYFYVPFETFSSFYGFLPWLIFFSLRFLLSKEKKTTLQLLLVSFLATSAFQVQTLFVVYLLIMVIILLNYVLTGGSWAIKKSVQWALLTLVVNLFWLIPVAYFTFFHSATNLEAQQNQLATPEVILMNQEYGDWSDILSLKGYWFDYLDRNSNGELQYLLEPWRNYLADSSLNLIIGGLILASFLGSVIFVVKYRKTNFSLVILLNLVFIFLLLTAGRAELGGFYRFLEEQVPLFSQIFRTTFTKWSVAFVLFISLGLASLFSVIYELINKFLKPIFVVFVFVLVLLPVIPFFKGQLIYDQMKVSYSDEYFELFDFFANQPKQTRIALLPAESVFGWDFFDWGYRGSGFLWYGLEQPVLSRAFDVFSKSDENFYHQFAFALRTGEAEKINKVLDVYDVSYLLYDKSVSYSNNLDYETIFNSNDDFAKVFEKNNLVVWQRIHENLNFVNPINNARLVDYDGAFQLRNIHPDFNQMVSLSSTNNFTVLPFINHSSFKLNNFFKYDDYVSFKTGIKPGEYSFKVPAFKKGDKLIVLSRMKLNNGVVELNFAPLARFRVADKEFMLSSLGSYKFDYSPEKVDKIFIEINDQSFILNNDEELTLPIFDLVVGEPIDINLNEIVNGIEERGFLLKNGGELSFKIESSTWDHLLAAVTFDFSLDKNSELLADVPSFNINLLNLITDISENSNCDIFQRGGVDKQVIANKLSYKTTEYGTYCESLKIDDIDTNYDFVVELAGKSIKGRPPKFLITSATDNYVYGQDLLAENDFKSSYLFLAQPFNEEKYFINLEIKSFGQETSSEFTKLDLTYFSLPINTLNKIELKTKNNYDFVGEMVINNTQKIGTGFYMVDLEVKTNEGLLSLSQAYDDFWWAVSFENNLTVWPHTLYKGWANAWLVPTGSHQVYLIYLPQVFMTFGFLLLPVIFIFIIFSKNKKAENFVENTTKK